MGKAIENKVDAPESDEAIERMFERVVCQEDQPNINKSCIICPECGQAILVVPALKKMNEAIENHVQLHKEEQGNAILSYTKPMNIRLALAAQILQKL